MPSPSITTEEEIREDASDELHNAARLGDVAAIDRILQALTDPDKRMKVILKKDNSGRTALHLTAYNNNIDALKKILQALPDTDKRMRLILEKDNYGQTAFRLAELLGNTAVVKELSKILEPLAQALQKQKSDQEIKKLVTTVNDSIGQYFQTCKPGFFKRHFDKERGLNRAKFYWWELRKHENNDWKKILIIQALLASDDGSTLKNSVAKAMGYDSVEEARKMVEKYIQNYCTENNMTIADVNHVVGKIVKFANTKSKDEPIPENIWDKIPEAKGPSLSLPGGFIRLNH